MPYYFLMIWSCVWLAIDDMAPLTFPTINHTRVWHGSIRMKMHDDIVRKLTQVRHVPNLKILYLLAPLI